VVHDLPGLAIHRTLKQVFIVGIHSTIVFILRLEISTVFLTFSKYLKQASIITSINVKTIGKLDFF
jgi:hypothetical protein